MIPDKIMVEIKGFDPESGIPQKTSEQMMKWFRWCFKYCMDCGVKLPSNYNRGDVCQKCFDDFNGMTIEELMQ